MYKRQNMDFPLVPARKRLDGCELPALFDHELPDIDLPPQFSRFPVIQSGFKGERLIDQIAKYALVGLSIKYRAMPDLRLDIVRHYRHSNDLAMSMTDAGARGRTEVLKDKNIFEPVIGMIQFVPSGYGRRLGAAQDGRRAFHGSGCHARRCR